MSKINKGLMTSTTDLWATPQDFFDQQNVLYGPFDIDVCADANNAKCAVYFDKASDGLTKKWIGKCWMNPPYGREIGAWMKKAYESSLNGAMVVCLVPAWTDRIWWHDYAVKGQITFIRGRLFLDDLKNNAPFPPSAVVVFNSVTTASQEHERMSITAMQLALEALQEHSTIKHPQQRHYRDEAITALRQAIAEAEKQEPVACNHKWIKTGAMEPGEARCIDCGAWNNTPPQRQLLTDEDIARIWRNETKPERNTDEMVRAFARAIEQAHGIKENT